MTTLAEELDAQHARAMKRYNARYNNALYCDAIAGYQGGKRNRLACALRLQDAALLLCGSPYERIDPAVKWTKEEQAFLDLFV